MHLNFASLLRGIYYLFVHTPASRTCKLVNDNIKLYILTNLYPTIFFLGRRSLSWRSNSAPRLKHQDLFFLSLTDPLARITFLMGWQVVLEVHGRSEIVSSC